MRNKNSKLSDAIGNLYRAALYIANEDFDSNKGLEFTRKALSSFKEKNKYKGVCQKINNYLNKYSIDQKNESLVLAEKILDQYLLLK